MQSVSIAPPEKLLSFSLVLETENLANADLEDLSQSLASLAQQDVPLTSANEVLIIDSGDTPTQLLDQLCDRYPWLKVHQVSSTAGYYKAKMLGAATATGQVVVYGDSDCTYESGWLRSLLVPFTQSHDIHIVAGETMTRGVGFYGTAMALTYIFPQYSGEPSLVPAAQYFLNNVAFRREFLLKHPIPTVLPLYRGNCVIHANSIRQQGHTIWRQPQARATHAPPSSLSHFFWRFLLIGHDYYWQQRLTASTTDDSHKATVTQTGVDDRDPMPGLKGKMDIFFDRIRKMVKHDRRHLLYFPFAIPVAIGAVLLIVVGYVITLRQPDYLLKIYSHLLEA
jgi:glycosyltransferase involved in cell wall biosynthesis